MAKLEFRDLRANEIDVRIAQIGEKGLSLLLYKDARCDMNILDETVGAFNWQRVHSRDNANCTVSIWDAEKGQWITKEDTGTESNTEAAKGLASDSFKRACFNWGIGRELYTAPFIFVKADKCKITTNDKGKRVCYDKFVVQEIAVENKKITGLVIVNAGTGEVVYSMGKKAATATAAAQPQAKAEPKPQPKQQQAKQETKPVEENRLKLRKFLAEHSNIDGQMLISSFDLKENSSNAEWGLALAYAEALAAGGAS